MENNRKVLVILISIIIVSLCGLVLFSYLNRNKGNKLDDEVTIKLTASDDYEDLFTGIISYNQCYVYDKYFEKDKVLVSELSIEDKIKFAINKYNIIESNENDLLSKNDYDENKVLYKIKNANLKKAYELTFADTYQELKEIKTSTEDIFTKDDDGYYYHQGILSKGCSEFSYQYAILSVSRENSKMEIDAIVVSSDANEHIRDLTTKQVYPQKSLSEYIDTLTHYRFTFTNRDDNLVFYSVEKLS